LPKLILEASHRDAGAASSPAWFTVGGGRTHDADESADPSNQGGKKLQAWGRPVDVLVMPDGALLVSDDTADAIYRISYRPP
jgi:glucose/arabinose dehydrogenase